MLPRAQLFTSNRQRESVVATQVWKDKAGNFFTGQYGTVPITKDEAGRLIRAAWSSAPNDADQATANAFCDAVSAWLWPRAQGFVAGAFFTVGAAWVWSWFL